MRSVSMLVVAVSLFVSSFIPGQAKAGGFDILDLLNLWGNYAKIPNAAAQLGSRPFYLLDDMEPSQLKAKLQQCANTTSIYRASDFSIGHRGAALQYPEHTKESYLAAAKMGAGILECDVTFTKDRELVCRHSQCDLHTTTNILATDLAGKCSEPFSPADPLTGKKASAKCCTSDITVDEFKSLCGKMDAVNTNAKTVAEYLDGTPNWRTDLYATCGTLMTHKESIALFKKLGRKFTPELKAPQVAMPYEGDYTQNAYAQQMIDEYKAANVNPAHVWAQSFNLDDVVYWLQNEPAYGEQAVYLDGRYGLEPTQADMNAIADKGVRIIAPPMWKLLSLDNYNNIVASDYTKYAKNAGLDIITWTLERSGPLASGGGWYHQSVKNAITRDGNTYDVLHALAKDVGVLGVFSDWPATTTFYANCMK